MEVIQRYGTSFVHIWLFFRKDHLCITYMQKSKSDVNPLTRYWQLKNTEIWLAESIFGYNLRTRFFPYMLFLQTISRQNWEIYFPKRKTPFDFLPENQVLTHTLSYGSLTPNKVSEKTNVLVLTKLLKRRVDRWMDRWLTFTWTIHPLCQFRLVLLLHRNYPIDLQTK